MHQIFISYSRRDQESADRLIRDLEECGFKIWVDRKGIRGGKDFAAVITQAIRESLAFLLVLSKSSAESTNVQKEITLAASTKRPIIPLIYEQCEMSDSMQYHLTGVQQIDFTGAGETGAALDELVDALKAIAADQGETVRVHKPAAATEVDQTTPQPAPARSAAGGSQPTSGWPPAGGGPQSSPAWQPSALLQTLPGRWTVQIVQPLLGIGATLTVDLAPTGLFQGQLVKPTGVTAVQGQWQATPNNQIAMQGQESNGFQVGPYMVVIQLNQVGPNQMTGVTSAGEQTVWQKIF